MTASSKDLPRWNSAIQSPFGFIGFKGYDPHCSLLFFVGVVDGTEHLKVGALPNNLDYDFILNDHHLMCLKQGAELQVAEISREKSAFVAWNPRWRIVLNTNEVIYDLSDTNRERPHRAFRLEGHQRGRNLLSLGIGLYGDPIPPVDVLAIVIAKRVSTQEVLDSSWKRLLRSGPDVVIDAKGTVRLSLVDLTTGKPLRYPAKGKHCRHLQPFDLEHYLSQSLRDGFTWLCPLCAQSCQWAELVVDKRVEELLADPPAGRPLLAIDVGLWAREDLPANMAIADVPIERATVDVQPVSAGKLFAPRGSVAAPTSAAASPFGGPVARTVSAEPPKPSNPFASFGPGAARPPEPPAPSAPSFAASAPAKSSFSFGPQPGQDRSPGLPPRPERPGAIGYAAEDRSRAPVQTFETPRSLGLPPAPAKVADDSPFGPRIPGQSQDDLLEARRQRSEFGFGGQAYDAVGNGHPQRGPADALDEDLRLAGRARAAAHAVVRAPRTPVGGLDELDVRRRADIVVDSNPVAGLRSAGAGFAVARAVDPFEDEDVPVVRQRRVEEQLLLQQRQQELLLRQQRQQELLLRQQERQRAAEAAAQHAAAGLDAPLPRRQAADGADDRLVRRAGDVFPEEERVVRRRVDPDLPLAAAAAQPLAGRAVRRPVEDDFEERLPPRRVTRPLDDVPPTRLRALPVDSAPVLRPLEAEWAGRQTLSELYDRGQPAGGVVDLADRRPAALPAMSGRAVDPFLEMQRRALGPGAAFEEFVEVPPQRELDPFEDDVDARPHRVLRRR